MDSALRIVDANLNRAAEGLRLLEDIARFVLNDAAISEQLKTMRHELVRADPAFNQQLLQSRDSVGDVGVRAEVPGEEKRKGLPLIVVANSRRVQESLRTLEEVAKLPEPAPQLDSGKFKQARFDLYTLEQKILGKLLRLDKVKYIYGLYAIIDTECLRGRSHIDAARQILSAGVKVIQLRDKTTTKKLLLPIARELRDLCSRHDVLFIVNDYLDIALASGADGLHVGQDDLPVESARKLLPIDKILGCSVTTVEQAIAAQSAGADYIAVGSVFPTTTKEAVQVVGLECLRRVRQSVNTPLVAIGGINKDNAREAIAAGANSVSVISAILQAQDIAQAAREIMSKIEACK